MRCIAILVLIGLFVATPASALEQDAGPAAVKIESERSPRCTVGAEQEFCVASWDHGSDSNGPGDDRFNVSRFANRVSVSLEAPALGPKRELGINASDLTVDHPVFHAANQTWLAVNDSRPDAARRYFTFESRQFRSSDAPLPSGLILSIDTPTPVPDPGGGMTSRFSIGVLSWDSRYYTTGGPFDGFSNYDSLRPLPTGLWINDSTDTEWGRLVHNLGCNAYEIVEGVNQYCIVLDPMQAAVDQETPVWKNSTPNVQVGTSVENVSAEVTPHRDPANFPRDQTNTTFVYSGNVTHLPALPPPSENPPAHDPMKKEASSDGDPPPAGPTFLYHPKDRPPRPFRPTLPQWPWQAAVASAAVGGIVLFAIAVALYHRITKKDALENANRLRVFETIQNEPGLRMSTIKTKLGLNLHTVKWHIRILEDRHLIEATGDKQRRFFVNGGSFSPREKREIVVASSLTTKAIVDLLRKNGEMSLPALALGAGIHLSTASINVSRLEAAGLVTKTRVEKGLKVHLAKTPPISRADLA